MKKITIIICCLFTLVSFSQVGINTTTPKAALDVESTNNGILIPRVQLTSTLDITTVINPNVGPLEISTLVYNIAPAGIIPNNVVSGFYYWNGSQWVSIANTAVDSDWYEQGTTTSPNAITDNMFHIGNVAIGKNTANFPLDIESSTNSIGINATVSGDFQKKGISSNLTYASGIQDQTGIESIINSTIGSGSNPYIYSFKSNLTNTGQGENYGFHNTITNANPSATTFGVKNTLNTSNSATGTENIISSTGNPTEIIGTKNTVFGTNDTSTFGTKNEITQTGTSGDRFGTYNSLTNSFGLNLYGTYNILNSGNTNRYGSYNLINNSGGFGSNYGVYSRVLTSGFENYAGYFLGDVAIGRTDLNKYILPQTRGTNGQIMQTDGVGNVTWQNPNTSFWSLNGNAGTNPPSTINFPITTTENFIGTTDYEDLVFGANNTSRMKISAFGNVGIGIDNPNAKFHINDNGSPYITSWITKTNLSGGTLGGYVSPTLIVSTTSTNGGTSEKYNNAQFIASGANSATNIAATFYATGGANNYAIIVPENSGDVGFGVTNPSTKLHIVDTSAGALRIEDGTQAIGRVLTSDVNGVGTWQNPNTFAWSLLGNTVTTGTHFIGSTNDVDLSFRRNGVNAGYIGQYNLAIGTGALQPSAGFYNVAIGVDALSSLGAADQNVAVGWNALSNVTTGGNNIGIGTGATVPTATANNQIRMGNINIGYAGIQVAWSVTSDRSWKSDIKNSNLGLSFINSLRPVSYFRNKDNSKKTEYGFIAQELDKTLTDFGATNNGIITKDDQGMLSVRYNDLLAPMVKAIQELKIENDTLKKYNESLNQRLLVIEKKLKP